MINDRRGPVLIDFPVNIQTEKKFHRFTLYSEIFNTSKLSLNIDNYISKSKRPIVVLGNGARDYISEVKKWLEISNIPFVTSWAAADLIDHTHPLRIGYIGVYGDRIANFALQNADLLIILGSRMDTRQTGGNLESCAREAVKIMVDIDINEINKLNERGFIINVPIISTVGDFLLNNTAIINNYLPWINTINNLRSEYNIEPNRKNGDIYNILQNIVFPERCIIIPDCGGNLVWTLQSITLKDGQKLFSNFGNSSMGYSLPASIGAAIATNKDIPIICICGDGGIQMNIQEFHTVAKLNLPITFIIINNLGYGIIRQFQDQYFGSRYIATSSDEVFGNENGLDIIKIATAYGISSQRSYDIKISIDKPVLYDVLIDPAQKIFPKLEFGNSLEHMYPYIPSLNEHMIINKTNPIISSGWVSK
jgi:acetolactate synthase-1/2/3 large subunit